MDLIIKPTEACNFKCTFCSSTDIDPENAGQLDHDYIFRFLDRYPDTNTIIVNGGDPLMMDPSYYWKIIKYLDDHNYPSTISFTSNLWPFYVKPKKWVELFNHPRMGISTSFQYGAGRLKGDLSIFTEEDFWNVSDKMLELCGYRPEFIAVIDDMNEHTAIKTVELAKKMDVVCKINYAMASGEQGYTYRLSKIYKLYLDIYNAGLGDWEYNVQQMIRRLASDTTTCPQNRMCDSGIRAFNPGGDYYSCGSLGDDKDYPIDFEYEMSGGFETPLQHDPEIQTMKMACYTCPMFKICNGCRKTVRDHKREGQVEDHCFEMKQLAPDILKLNGKDPSEVTPYVREYD
jgi:radical SAM protein with 4Fe4S-binding SPASM domain|tara:strand:- start:10457 stop:11491 length:1035 start_codon:yes stop_codon:yes gene_type:complete